VTATRVSARPAAAAAARWPAPRLARLYLASRRLPVALVLLAACAGVLRLILNWPWLVQGTGAVAVPLAIEAAAAGVIAVTARSPFGEPERVAGRWLPWLRLGSAAGLIAAGSGLLCAAVTAAGLPGGSLDLLRNIGGLAGLGLLTAAVLGGGLAWAGPAAYLVVAEGGLAGNWTTPWMWPGRPPHDLGGWLCAGTVLAAGLAVTASRGSRDRPTDPA
jgi:hypothetical protein